MPVEVIVQTFGAAALLLLLFRFSGGDPVLVGPKSAPNNPERKAWMDTIMALGGGGGNDGSAEIRRQEEKRQKDIRASTERINRIFDQFEGIKYEPVTENRMTQADPRDVWEKGRRYAPTGEHTEGNPYAWRDVYLNPTTGKYVSAGSLPSSVEYEMPYTTDKRVETGNSLYDQYRTDYLGHYTPQLQDQFQDAQKNVQFDLARRGATESSAGQQKLADLLESYNKQQTQLQSQATGAMNKYRGSVEQQRQQLISQAQAGMAPTDASNLASNAFNSLKAQQPEYSALGDVFGQFADLYGTNLRAQGAGFEGYNLPGARPASTPGQSGTSKIRS